MTAKEWADKAENLIKSMYDLGHTFDFEHHKCGQVYVYEKHINEFIEDEFKKLEIFLNQHRWTNITQDKKSIKATDGDDYIELKKRDKFYNPTKEDRLEYIVINDLELIIHIDKEAEKFDIEIESDFKMVEDWTVGKQNILKYKRGYTLKAEEWKEEYENIRGIMEKNQQIIDDNSFNFRLIYKKDRCDRDEDEKAITSVVDILNMLND